uniref:G protein-coupled receptor n=1 Tax=Gongylonema pulchrum TaxID=637853 RepID=A0A183D924_9BILA
LILTRTMFISCILTIFLHVLPMAARYICRRYEVEGLEFVTLYGTISSNLNPLAILATIFLLQDDIREAAVVQLPQRLQLMLQRFLPKKYFVFNTSIKTLETNKTVRR